MNLDMKCLFDSNLLKTKLLQGRHKLRKFRNEVGRRNFG